MKATLHNHQTSDSVAGRTTCNLRFARIDLIGGSNGELQELSNRLVDRATAYEIEVSTKRARPIA